MAEIKKENMNEKGNDVKVENGEQFGTANKFFDVDYISNVFHDRKTRQVIVYEQLTLTGKNKKIKLKTKLVDNEKSLIDVLGVKVLDVSDIANANKIGTANHVFDVDFVERSFYNEALGQEQTFNRIELTAKNDRDCLIKVKVNKSDKCLMKHLGIPMINKKDIQE